MNTTEIEALFYRELEAKTFVKLISEGVITKSKHYDLRSGRTVASLATMLELLYRTGKITVSHGPTTEPPKRG